MLSLHNPQTKLHIQKKNFEKHQHDPHHWIATPFLRRTATCGDKTHARKTPRCVYVMRHTESDVSESCVCVRIGGRVISRDFPGSRGGLYNLRRRGRNRLPIRVSVCVYVYGILFVSICPLSSNCNLNEVKSGCVGARG